MSAVLHLLHVTLLPATAASPPQPLQLGAANHHRAGSDPQHHRGLDLAAVISRGWERIESGARVGRNFSPPAPCWLVMVT